LVGGHFSLNTIQLLTIGLRLGAFHVLCYHTQHDFFVSIADQEQQHDQQQQQYRFAQQQQSRLNDPAIMSASFGVQFASPQDAFGHTEQVFGPPGLAYSAGLQNNVVNDGKHYLLLFLRGRPVRHTECRVLLGQDFIDYP
jgi:hypothetical protein